MQANVDWPSHLDANVVVVVVVAMTLGLSNWCNEILFLI